MKDLYIKLVTNEDQTNPLNVGEFKTSDGEEDFTLYVGIKPEEDDEDGTPE